MFFVDFLAREGHFRLKKLINYRKNLVWKSVFDWVCSVMYMYCIYFGIVLPSCICTVYINYISTVYVYVVNNIYLSISCTVHEVQKLAKKSCYIRSCTRSPLDISENFKPLYKYPSNIFKNLSKVARLELESF